MIIEPGAGVTADGLVEHTLCRIVDIRHCGCSYIVGHGVRLLDNEVHRGNFRLHRAFAGKYLVDLLITGLCDLCQSITQMVHCIRDAIALLAFDRTLVRDGGQTLLPTPIPLHQIVSSAPLVYC
ncbi:Protein of unknown function [Mycobacterium canettii CIPT 140070017]|nr:Protein of unknown function [Mycobacterium canettii CIPT 140070017]